MTLGTLGSTLNDELNRLANGGTYRDKINMVDEALAAKQWANREYVNPVSTDTVGILNEIAGLGLDKKNWLDFNGVCNYIAGTTGLPAAAALRQIYTTNDLLTSQAAYYVDATTPTNWGSLGYVYLNGTTSGYLSVPDSNDLDITGNIDLRAKIALDNWTLASNQTVIAKFQTTTTDSYYMTMLSGNIVLLWSPDGTTASQVQKQATATVPFTNGQTGWIRATRNATTGDCYFYTSTDGNTWTQLGTVLTSTPGSMYSSTSQIEIGSNRLGTNGLLAGKVYRAQILNGIGGTTVLDVNIASNYLSSNLNTFTATTGQTVTVNGVDVVANNSTIAGSLLPTTLGSSTAADSNDPKFLDFSGTNYVYTPGTQLSNMSVLDNSSLDITGDIDLRCKVAMDDWTPSAISALVTKWDANQWSYSLSVDTNGTLLFDWSTNGTVAINKNSTVATGFVDGTTNWVRATLDVDNGASGNTLTFYTSTDGSTWTQLGSAVTTAGVTSIFSGSANVIIGSRTQGFGQSSAGKFFNAQIYNGIAGTKVLDVDTSVITAGSATSFTAVTGQTVTINRSTSGRKTVAVTQPVWLFGTDDYMEVNNRYIDGTTPNLYLPGIASNNASAADSVALSITGDIDIRCKVASDDWTFAEYFLSKAASAADSYTFYLTAGGNLAFDWTNSSAVVTSKTSTVATGVTDGSTKWVRVTLDVDNGAAGNDVKFYTSDDGSTWTQLGTTLTTAGVTNIRDTTASLWVGEYRGTSVPFRGKFYRAQIRNGIDGTLVFDANFETGITSLNQTSFTESSANAATVTINRSGSTYRSAGITTSGYLYPGATNTFTASATDYLNFGASDSATVLWIGRQWATPTNFGRILSKEYTTNGNQGYNLQNYGTNFSYTAAIYSGSQTSAGAGTPTYVSGSLKTIGFGLDRTAQTLTRYIDTTGTSASVASVGSISSIAPFNIGSKPDNRTAYADFELIGAAVFRIALTASQIRQITNYFANREVYL